MSKNARRYKKEFRRDAEPLFSEIPPPRVKRDTKPLTPMNEAQKAYLNSFNVNDITFGIGPAGTGKTYLSAAWAADQIAADHELKLIITRPAVEADADESGGIGFLPGDMGEKFAPYFAPVRAILEKRLGAGQVQGMIESGRIQIAPIGFLRGWTFEDSIVLLDEAQNTTPKLMEMFLTRIGKGSTLIVDGDLRQSDLKQPSGLFDARKRLAGIKGIGFIHFTKEDIVRHGLVRTIVDRYNPEDESIGEEAFDPPAFLRAA